MKQTFPFSDAKISLQPEMNKVIESNSKWTTEKRTLKVDMKLPRKSPLKQIRKFCHSCCGRHNKSIRFCHDAKCKLWGLRFGKYPSTLIRERGKKFRQLFEENNFKRGY